MVVAGIPVLLSTYLPFLALTVLLGVTFVGIGLAVSTLSTSGTRTIAAAVGLYFVFRLVWRVPLTFAAYLSYGYQPLEGNCRRGASSSAERTRSRRTSGRRTSCRSRPT